MHSLSNLEVIIILGLLIIISSGLVIYYITKNLVKITTFSHVRTRNWIKLLHENKLDFNEFYGRKDED